MSNHYFKLIWRFFSRQTFFSVVNLSGLAVGLAACWVIALFVKNETSFDQFLPDQARICQVNLEANFGGMEGVTSNTPPPVGATMVSEFPEIEASTRVFAPGETVVRSEQPGAGAVQQIESGLLAVDSNFLELFGFALLEGDARYCLDQPGSVVLTEQTARKYFGDSNPVGKSLRIGDRPATVRAVLRNIPANSSIQFDMLMPIADFPVVQRFSWSWVWLQVDTWVRLRSTPSPETLLALKNKFPAMVQQHAAEAFARIGQPYEEFVQKGGRWNFFLHPLADVHLKSDGLVSRLQTLGDRSQVWTFGIVGMFILLLACVNFMNLSTARSLQRSREVGVRKVLGSGRRALVGQFMAESLLYCLVAAVLAMGLVQVALPMFNQLTGEAFAFADLFSGPIGALALTLPLVAALFGGLYPALYLSGFSPLHLFKGRVTPARSGHATLRGGLVVFQFVISIALIISTLVVYNQLQFVRNYPLGIHTSSVLVVNNTQHLGEWSAQEAFRQQLLQQPGIRNATISTDLPTSGAFGDFYVPEQGDNPNPVSKDLTLSSYMTDYDFVPTLDIQLAAGRNFSRDFPSDSAAVILNETAARMIGWQNPVGQWLRYPGGDNRRYKVIGVLKDFHTASLHTVIEPFALFHQSSKSYELPKAYLALRVQSGAEKETLRQAEAAWNANNPSAPFDYAFLDQDLARMYRSEEKTGAVLGIFTGLSLFIACLGLFALAAFTAERRSKEIGIRKVLGASVLGITGLLAKDFLKLVVLALALASPVAWYFMARWLEHFRYHTQIEWWVFALAGSAAIGATVLSVCAQSIKAALAHPVHALRGE
ncbi:MAG: ABC transporter permease [Saprospiraceae bacterium]|nr:ABC transporter permease [Saprospiraceae bacterium]